MWIEFEFGESQPRDRMYVSMSRIGEILLNRRAHEELGSPEAVKLFFDPEAKKIGLRPASPLLSNSFGLKAKGRSKNQLVRAKPFIVRYGIKVDETVRFLSPVVENGILVLDLEMMAPVRQRTQKARTNDPTV